MKLSSHYMRLREHYPYAIPDQELTATLGELAEALQCTHRNAQLLMGKMQQLGWVEWRPKRGRSSRSSLIFRAPAEDIALSIAKELVEHKDLRGALEQLSLFSPDSAAKESFHRWLSGQFGYTSEVQDNKRLDILRFPLTQPLQSLDPATIHFTTEAHLVHQLFDPLVRYNRLTQTIEPHIAHAWEVNSDRTVWTFHLRKGILFHHGRELAAEDVSYTFDRLRLLADGALYSWVHRQIERVEAVDPITVSVRLKEQSELFLQFAGTNRASIVPADRCAELGEAFALSPVGTGPFKLSHLDETMCVLDAFAPYFQGRAHLDRVELWHIPNLQQQDFDRTLGSFQMLHNYRLPDEASASWQQIQQKGATCRFLTFNLLKQGPLQDPDVRGLVMSALDRGRLLARIGGDAVAAADSFLTYRETTEAAPAAEPCQYDPERLRQLVSSSTGYRGERLRLCTIMQYAEDAQHVQALLQEAGFACEVKLLTAQQFKSEQRLHADLLLFSLMLDTDAELRLFDLYTSMQRHLEPSVKQVVASLLRQMLLEPSQTGRAELLARIESHLTAKRVLCFLYQKQLKTIYHTSVKGISLDALDWVQFKNIWFRP
ncbi:ABC transporter substrate-binding protein [Paenibacillus filicis]|uniref:ABC transporter substrate-binding protein n=1 Tax=Paenibacillus filicis TaxID=669464 RepID=A0ABU9DGV0_9BACL